MPNFRGKYTDQSKDAGTKSEGHRFGWAQLENSRANGLKMIKIRVFLKGRVGLAHPLPASLLESVYKYIALFPFEEGLEFRKGVEVSIYLSRMISKWLP